MSAVSGGFHQPVSHLRRWDHAPIADAGSVDSDVVCRVELPQVDRFQENVGGAPRIKTKESETQIGEGKRRQKCREFLASTQQRVVGQLQAQNNVFGDLKKKLLWFQCIRSFRPSYNTRPKPKPFKVFDSYDCMSCKREQYQLWTLN